MAEIFLAKLQGHEGFEKPVVLKRIHRAFLEDRQFRNMLIDEALISMGLAHNNIVQILDVGRAQGQFFLVLELVDGWDLARIIDRSNRAGRPLPLGLGLYVVAEVCRALAYAHGKTDIQGRPLGIVHRDVSPQNVLVSNQGEVKLGDFGIAKALTKREKTASGVVKGKISFMSPEQAQGLAIDQRSDLFAVGSMLYLLATGARPFEGPTDLETLLRVQNGECRPPEQVRPDLSPALAFVIRRAMSAAPDDRYQTADELLVDVEGILRAEHGSTGQTELKLWLSELARADGLPPISRQRATAERAAEAGPELREGNSVQLGDEDDREDARDDVDGPRFDDRTPLGDLEGRENRRRTDPTRNFSAEGSIQTPGKRRVTGTEDTALTDLSLVIGREDGPPEDRFARESRRRAIWVALITLAAVGGAGFLGYKAYTEGRLANVLGGAADAHADAGAPTAPPPAAAVPSGPDAAAPAPRAREERGGGARRDPPRRGGEPAREGRGASAGRADERDETQPPAIEEAPVPQPQAPAAPPPIGDPAPAPPAAPPAPPAEEPAAPPPAAPPPATPPPAEPTPSPDPASPPPAP